MCHPFFNCHIVILSLALLVLISSKRPSYSFKNSWLLFGPFGVRRFGFDKGQLLLVLIKVVTEGLLQEWMIGPCCRT